MSKDILAPVIEQIAQTKKVEKLAKRNPGYEEDHDYDLSEDYSHFSRYLKKLQKTISDLPQPEGWLELNKWCDKNDHHFGEAVMANVHRDSLDWEPGVRSIRTMILESIHDRLKERAIRPEDENIWSDNRVINLLTETDWKDFKTNAPGGLIERGPNIDFILINIAHLLGKEGKDLRTNMKKELLKAVDLLEEIDGWIDVKGFTLETEGKKLVMTVKYDLHDLPRGSGVSFDPYRTDGKWPDFLDELFVSISKGRKAKKVSAMASTKGSKAEIGEGWVKLIRTPTDTKPWTLKKGTPIELRVDIRMTSAMEDQLDEKIFPFSPPKLLYIGAKIDAPEPPEPVDDPTHQCKACGKKTMVLIGDNCPSCTYKGKVGGKWDELECPSSTCSGRRFRKRFKRTLDDDLVCIDCGSGWTVKDGEVQGPDLYSRAMSILPPGFNWRWPVSHTVKCMDLDKLPETDVLKALHKDMVEFTNVYVKDYLWIGLLQLIGKEMERYLDQLRTGTKEEKEWLKGPGKLVRDIIDMIDEKVKDKE